ncbi:unnamed protein product [Ambrosiozyma monospora]|uniref:Unnamed protein product n=1 Tax=Ambrosiozyma monospora TaxID=43982 RepID=A0A9W6Z202_AMBMO|nr:unnamed protein product [Ambrosiozyma monospora]
MVYRRTNHYQTTQSPYPCPFPLPLPFPFPYPYPLEAQITHHLDPYDGNDDDGVFSKPCWPMQRLLTYLPLTLFHYHLVVRYDICLFEFQGSDLEPVVVVEVGIGIGIVGTDDDCDDEDVENEMFFHRALLG